MIRRSAAVADAGINIALVKYWGKRDERLNLPEAGSLSLTLAGMGTRTAVRFDEALAGDRVVIDGQPAPPAVAMRTSRFLDLVRGRTGLTASAHVDSRSTVPIGSGLASSASSFAALAAAAARAAGLAPTLSELSALARRGSGSAARSIFGGFVEMDRGERPDGEDAVARPLLAPDAWAVAIVVARTSAEAKAVGSSEGMRRTQQTSPYHAAFVASQAAALASARDAVERRDLAALGEVTEANALRMHADAMAADPPLLYWNGATVEALSRIRRLRSDGLMAYVTVDAGPHVKVLCARRDATAVESSLRTVPGVLDARTLLPGPGVRVSDDATELATCA